jgi:hypothetical protein
MIHRIWRSSTAKSTGVATIPDIDNTFVALDPEHNHRWFVGVNPWGFCVNATKAPVR